MSTDPNQLPLRPNPEEGELHPGSSLERAYEQGTMSLAEARRFSGETITTQVFQFSPETEVEASPGPGLEAVTPDHTPLPNARKEDTTPAPRKDKDWRSRMAADQPPASQRPPERDESRRLTLVKGGKADRR